MNQILALVIWVVLSILFPLGILGDFIYRKLNGLSVSNKWWTYLISLIPIFGPIISFYLLI